MDKEITLTLNKEDACSSLLLISFALKHLEYEMKELENNPQEWEIPTGIESLEEYIATNHQIYMGGKELLNQLVANIKFD